jgi:hypothetical protein
MTVHEMDDDVWSSLRVPITRLSRDLREAARTLGDDEARHLVDAYYIAQENRKRAMAQERTLTEGNEPATVIDWLALSQRTIEGQIKVALDFYTQDHVMGGWMRGIYGIGPVISAGLLAHIYMGYWCAHCRGKTREEHEEFLKDKRRKLPPHDFTPERSSPTAGHIYQYAGIAGSGQRPWEKGKKRPFNAALKTLCWKVGQSFMKFSGKPECYYGQIYRLRKEQEVEMNERGAFSAQAEIGAKRVRSTTDAYTYYSAGKLPPAHIDARARRYAVKIFLSHMHAEWYRRAFGEEPPLPYAVAHLGHAHIVPPAPGHHATF